MIYIYNYIPVQSGQHIDGLQQNKGRVSLFLTSSLYHGIQKDDYAYSIVKANLTHKCKTVTTTLALVYLPE